jgi:hypothetical protein
MAQYIKSIDESDDPKISSMEKYESLAQQYDLLDGPAVVREAEDNSGDIEVRIDAHFGGQTFVFSSIDRAVQWLALVYHAADHAVKHNS